MYKQQRTTGQSRSPAPFHQLFPNSHLIGVANTNQQIALSIGLRLHNEAGLKSYVQDMLHPGSVNYHRFLTSAQILGAFSPTPVAYNNVLHFLQASRSPTSTAITC